ncbi:MAG: DUF2279 domain-containing protein [Bacteroidota bacterium]|jgi:hypothetical protein
MFNDKAIYKITLSILLCSIMLQNSYGQHHFLPPSDQFRRDRLDKVIIAESAIFALTSIGLYYLWYKKFPRKKFHFFNDGKEWLQIDKVGHATTAYNISNMQHDLLRWCGVPRNDAIIAASATSLAYMSIIEILDGFSGEWGFSPADMLANFSGTVLFATQQYGWNEQRIGMKISARFTPYAKENKQLLGKNWASRLMKDYNGQTYWLSFNLRSFLPSNSEIPEWSNISLGYGASGMIHAKGKGMTDKNGHLPDRIRRFFLAPDIDPGRIQTESAISNLFYLTQFIKIPAPAIEFNSKRKFKLHAIYY